MGGNNLSRANELYNQIQESFTYKRTDPRTGETFCYPASYSEVKNAGQLMEEIDRLDIQDNEFNDRMKSLRATCNRALQRKLMPSAGFFLTALIWVGMNVFMAAYELPAKLKGYYEPAEADSLYSATLVTYQNSLELHKSRPEEEDSPKWIQFYSEKIESLKNTGSQEYLNQKNAEVKSSALKKTARAGVFLILFFAYLYAVRTPMFLVYKRRKYLMDAKEKNLKTNFIWDTLSAIWAIPDEKVTTAEVEIKMSDGSIRKEMRTNDTGNWVKYMFIIVFLVVTFFVMLAALPLITIIKYLQNYHYSFFDRLFGSSGEQSKEEGKEEAHVNTVKRKMPVQDGLKVGDGVLARFSADNYLYYGTIEGKNDQNVRIRYFDGTMEEVLITEICELEHALKKLEAEADYQKKGLYYSCRIIRKIEQAYEVKYEDGSLENVGIEQLRFY